MRELPALFPGTDRATDILPTVRPVPYYGTPRFRAGAFGQPRKRFGRYCSIYRDGKTGRPFRAGFIGIPPR